MEPPARAAEMISADCSSKRWSTFPAYTTIAAANIDPIPIVAIEGEARDSQRLALRARFLHPIVAAAGQVTAISNLENHALEPDLQA